ncbi:MAG: hypothetical protein QG670_1677 [Thermoproteota archaeon]|nr:hypothetical protein [Thermoproteota archaeon]
MFHVEKLREEDFEFAVHLTDTMNWDLVKEDFEFAMKLEPDGCFLLFSDSEKIGLATTASFGRIGWLGNVIVDERHRGGGGGSVLVEHSIQYLKSKNVETIGLYGYIERIPFYMRYGFRYDSEFVLLKGKGFSSQTGSHVREAEKEDRREIVELDSLCFGASRKKLFDHLIGISGNICYILEDNKGMLGFAAAKVYNESAEIGPLVCRRECGDAVSDLLRAILGKLKDLDVLLCVGRKDSEIMINLKLHRFREEFPLARMFQGPPVSNNYFYVAESLERG